MPFSLNFLTEMQAVKEEFRLPNLRKTGGADETRTRDLLRDRKDRTMIWNITECDGMPVTLPCSSNYLPVWLLGNSQYHPISRVDKSHSMWTSVWTWHAQLTVIGDSSVATAARLA